VDVNAILQWLQDPQHLTIVLAVLTAAAAVAHALGYPVPILSKIIDFLNKLKGAAPAAAPAQPNLIGGAGGMGVNPDHPAVDAIAEDVGQAHGLPRSHPLVRLAVLAALKEAPAILSLFPATAPFGIGLGLAEKALAAK
jgi:hypothetical protein